MPHLVPGHICPQLGESGTFQIDKNFSHRSDTTNSARLCGCDGWSVVAEPSDEPHVLAATMQRRLRTENDVLMLRREYIQGSLQHSNPTRCTKAVSAEVFLLSVSSPTFLYRSYFSKGVAIPIGDAYANWCYSMGHRPGVGEHSLATAAPLQLPWTSSGNC
uniref:Uncharacterized protein n=1 Tax=Hyaloperonospora arabidopsidis (strain Emoy2) TaxID=559515 RepID=M4BBL7_HYAAE